MNVVDPSESPTTSAARRARRRRRIGWLGVVGVLVAAFGLGLAAPASAAPQVYAALGDSYASGLGTRDYDDADCRRGRYAYPALVAADSGAELRARACTGAEVAGVQDGQLDVLDAAVTQVTVQVGGNDAGFTDVILQCAKPWPTTCWGDIDKAEAFIRDTLPGRLDGLYDAIAAGAPNAQVVVVGYPRLFNGEECNAGSRISSGEQERLNGTADLLAETTSARAEARGFGYVDAREAFTGHAVCDDVEYVNGLSNPVDESYHPNRDGHVAYADLVGAALSS